jgi:acetyl esterase/lipase
MTDRHPLAPEDQPVVVAMRQATEPHKGEPWGPEARPMFDEVMAATPAAADVRFEAGRVGGVDGWWCHPAGAASGACLLYLHGGGYNFGSAEAFRNLASQLAVRARADTFIPDYRLAPEHPFPAALDDAETVYRGLVAEGAERVVIAGDSAGGGLTLALLTVLAAEKGAVLPLGAAVMSPWTDLTLSGTSMRSRAEADPIFTSGVMAALARAYSDKPADPRVSPLFADVAGLPPIHIEVGDDELLLDDSVRFAERAQAAGVEVSLSIWMGMPHVFQSSFGRLAAAGKSLDAMGAFLAGRLTANNL